MSSVDPSTNHNESHSLWAVVPAAGIGTRLASALPKQYLPLKDRCILQRTIDTLLEIDSLQGVVVVLSETDTHWSQLAAAQHPRVMTTTGGASRAESVTAGLKMVCDNAQDNNTMVLVHDAARALTATSDINRLIDRVMQAPEHGGLLATKVQDTLKRAAINSNTDEHDRHQIEVTVSRDDLWQAQTPQMFRAQSLLDTLIKHREAIVNGDITDESCAMEKAGFSPALVEALQPNFKITHLRDLDMAVALVEASDRNLVGQ